MTDIATSTGTDSMYWQTCAGCGRRIRLVGDQPHLSLLLEQKSLQRRAFQCVGCGGLVCQECRAHGHSCTCRSNIWLARPYLDLSVVRSI